ncbi:MAG: amylo-alpha-1,6-glucosidase [Bacteroidales bacterium]|nr:amylo-alpha-1,6-glucosidase [Bacteroidales bacterium]MCF8332916.1 amylo-alpha-1,6-glucosidase [Bacteroidales bacterium]
MSYINFDKNQLINLEYSLSKEMLRTSRSGAYACTTIINCNTRKYHGLLVAPQPNIDNELHVLLSAFDETIIQRDTAFNLGIHKFPGGFYKPGGHKYIRDFDSEPIPTLIYRVGGVVLKKESLFTFNTSRLMIRYTLMDAHSDTYLQFRPFMAFRGRHSLSKANTYVNKKFHPAKNGIQLQLYDSYTPVFLQFSKNPEYVHVPDWYYNIEYFREQERGYDYQEDLYVPGYFEIPIKKGESIVFTASLDEVNPASLKNMFYREKNKRIPRDSFEHCLENSAEQFIIQEKDKAEVVAGYPRFGIRGRDTFIALPGLTLSLDRPAIFHKVVKTMVKAMKGPLFPNVGGVLKEKFDSADAPLWYIRSLQQLAEYTGDAAKVWKDYKKPIQTVLNGYLEGTDFDIKVQEDGLVWAGIQGKAVTWMDAYAEGQPVTPRTGMTVEINALWYNALKFALEAAEKAGDKTFVNQWKEQAETFPERFMNTFWNQEKGYLADFVDHQESHWEIRPNMVIATSLPYTPIDEGKRRAILHVVHDHLVTPRGLRTLSPRNRNYKGEYKGNQNQRHRAYHQGTAWPWMLTHFAQGYLKINGEQGLPLIKELYHGFEDEMINHGIGTISEVYSGNPPHESGGNISQAWNVAGLLRIRDLIEQYEK